MPYVPNVKDPFTTTPYEHMNRKSSSYRQQTFSIACIHIPFNMTEIRKDLCRKDCKVLPLYYILCYVFIFIFVVVVYWAFNLRKIDFLTTSLSLSPALNIKVFISPEYKYHTNYTKHYCAIIQLRMHRLFSYKLGTLDYESF